MSTTFRLVAPATQNEEERFSLKTEMHFLEMVIRNMVAHEMIDKDKILKCYCGQHAVFNCVELESFWNSL